MKKAKKFLSFFLAFAMTLSTVAAFDLSRVFAFQGNPFYTGMKLTLVDSSNTRYPVLKMNGNADYSNFAPEMVEWINPDTGEHYPAYCANPAHPGEGDASTSDGSYNVDIGEFDPTCLVDEGGSGGSGLTGDDIAPNGNGHTVHDVILGAIVAGYPNVPAATLLGGTYGATTQQVNYRAYLATKMAIWALIHKNYPPSVWSANQAAVSAGFPQRLVDATYNAFKAIVAAGQAGAPSQTHNAFTLTSDTPAQSGGFWSQKFTLSGSMVPGTATVISTSSASTAFDSPDGVKLYDSTGATELSKNTKGEYILPAGQMSFVAKVAVPATTPYDIKLPLYCFAQDGSTIDLSGNITNE